VVSGLLAAALLGRILKAKQRTDTALLLELPAIRRPKLRVVVSSTYFRTKAYIQKAGGIILIVSIVLWAMTNLPWKPGQSEEERFTGSIAASAGRWMDPVMRPMGLDGRAGVSLLSAFAAREVFVSSLALVLAASSEGAAPGEEPLLLSMRQATLADGAPLFTLSTAVGLIVFFIFALQCMSTIVVCRKETGDGVYRDFRWCSLPDSPIWPRWPWCRG
jgi:ferrous iron transport protein B